MKVYHMWPFTKRNVPTESSTAEIPVIHPTTHHQEQESDVSVQSSYPDVKGRRLPLGDTMSAWLWVGAGDSEKRKLSLAIVNDFTMHCTRLSGTYEVEPDKVGCIDKAYTTSRGLCEDITQLASVLDQVLPFFSGIHLHEGRELMVIGQRDRSSIRLSDHLNILDLYLPGAGILCTDHITVVGDRYIRDSLVRNGNVQWETINAPAELFASYHAALDGDVADVDFLRDIMPALIATDPGNLGLVDTYQNDYDKRTYARMFKVPREDGPHWERDGYTHYLTIDPDGIYTFTPIGKSVIPEGKTIVALAGQIGELLKAVAGPRYECVHLDTRRKVIGSLVDIMTDLTTTKVDVDITPKIIRRAELALNLVPSLLAADAKILEGL